MWAFPERVDWGFFQKVHDVHAVIKEVKMGKRVSDGKICSCHCKRSYLVLFLECGLFQNKHGLFWNVLTGAFSRMSMASILLTGEYPDLFQEWLFWNVHTGLFLSLAKASGKLCGAG